jgi:hypothetical protein
MPQAHVAFEGFKMTIEMSPAGPNFQIIEKTINNTVSYTGLIGASLQPLLGKAIADYKRKIDDHTILIVDYRKGDPGVRPQDLNDLLDEVGDAWSFPERIVYLYNESNRMRTAHFSKLVLKRGGDVVAVSSWRDACEALGMDLGGDPLDELDQIVGVQDSDKTASYTS